MKIRIILLALLLPLCWGCRKNAPEPPSKGEGRLTISASVDDRISYLTRAGAPPLASELILEVLSGQTRIHCFSPLGAGEKEISVEAGDYTLLAYSALFEAPAFDMPVYSAETQVSVAEGATASATLACVQSNAGVKIVYSDAFRAAHTDYTATVTQNQQSLSYSGADAGRTGYFATGYVTLQLIVDGETHSQQLQLFPQRVYTVNVQDEAPGSLSFGVSVSVDGDCTDEDVDVFFPADEGDEPGDDPGDEPGEGGDVRVVYTETVGATPVEGQSALSGYEGWLASGITYTNGNNGISIVVPQRPSGGYPNASGGNAVRFNWDNSRMMTISGINTLGATSLELTFGLSNDAGTAISTGDLTVNVSTDGNSFSPLTYALTPFEHWSLARVTAGIPAAASLTFQFVGHTSDALVDDIRITAAE